MNLVCIFAVLYSLLICVSCGGGYPLDDLLEKMSSDTKSGPISTADFITALTTIDQKYVDQYVKEYSPFLRKLTKEEKEDVTHVLKNKLGFSDDQTDQLMQFLNNMIIDVTCAIPTDRGKVDPNPQFIQPDGSFVYDKCFLNAPMHPRRVSSSRTNPPTTMEERVSRSGRYGITEVCRNNLKTFKDPMVLPNELWEQSTFPPSVKERIKKIKTPEEYWRARPEFSELSKEFVCNYLDPQYSYAGFDETCFAIPSEHTTLARLRTDVDLCRNDFTLGAVLLGIFGSVLGVCGLSCSLSSMGTAFESEYDGIKSRTQFTLIGLLGSVLLAGYLGGVITLAQTAQSPSCTVTKDTGLLTATVVLSVSAGLVLVFNCGTLFCSFVKKHKSKSLDDGRIAETQLHVIEHQ